MARNPLRQQQQQGQNGNFGRKENKRESKKHNFERKKHSNQLQQKTKRQNEKDSGLLYPGGDTAFKALVLARFCAGIWSHIGDCDETYNYWEPMHYLVFGHGLQTWEYSPEYALRSYTYLLVHAVPAFVYHKIFQPNPLFIFYLTRCLLALFCSFVEVYFYKAVCREFGVHIGRICLAFQLFAAGMFISSTAFLPSSFAMYMLLAACWAWWTQMYPLAICCIAFGAILGWPFAALLGIPIAGDILFRQREWKLFLQWSILSAIVTLVPMIAIDTMHFGRFVIAPFNIIKYNILGGAGPNLYGTEPMSFYLINGFLNFNFVWILSLLCPFFLVLQYFFVPAKNKTTLTLPHYISLAPLYLWLIVFLLQPHKEERFLFPIYPLICLSGAISVDIIQKLCYRVFTMIKTVPPGTHYLDKTVWIMVVAIFASSVLSISRIFSLYQNYHAPLDLLMELNRFPSEGRVSPKSSINMCVGKDWHRFPSSFCLPNGNWQTRFVKSEFSGMLPAPYADGENATRIVPKHFNDQNREAMELYFDVHRCHFMLDLDTGRQSDLEPIYARQTHVWKTVKSLAFLDAPNSHPLFRAFYIPFLTPQFVRYGNFSLLQRIPTKAKSKA